MGIKGTPGKIVGMGLAAAGLLAGCAFGQAPAPTPVPFVINTPGAAASANASVIYTVARGPVVDAATFPAKVNLASVQDLFFGTPGRVKEIYVASGDAVVEGQLVAELDTRMLAFDLQAAKIGVKLAEQRLSDGQITFRFSQLQRELALQVEKLRLAQLQSDPTTNPALLAIQEVAVRQADLALQQLEGGPDLALQAEVDRAHIAQQKVEAQLDDARIVAPFAGQALLFDALKKGKVVQAYEPVASLVDPQAIVVEANLVPDDLADLSEGMPVQIQITSPLSKTIDGVIQTLPQPFGTGAGNVTRVAPAPGVPANQLRPGVSAKITVVRSREDHALWLPVAAMQGYKDNYFVRLVDGRELPVVVGIWGPDRVEIRSGLTEGQAVVGK